MRTAVLGFAIVVHALGALACTHGEGRERSEPGSQPAVSTTTTVRAAVVWPAPSTIDAAALTSLAAGGTKSESELRALVARSVVPVLAPKSLRLASPSLIVEGAYFALTGRADGATISLQGTRTAHRYEGIAPVAGNRDLRKTKGHVSVNEGIRTAAWIENGVAYSLDVECGSAGDARCQSDDFVISVVEQLAFVGGSGR